MDILKQLQIELGIKASQVENTVKLLDEGNTVPFIARYRKEVTGSLDDQIIRQLAERLTALRNLEEKREMVRNAITEQGAMTDELSAKLEGAMTQTEIEDIYRPYRPKRRTRASIAKEKGLEPLANIIMLQMTNKSIEEEAEAFVSEEKEVASGGIYFRTGIFGAFGRIRRRFCRRRKRRGICGGCHQWRKRHSGGTVLR